VCRNALQSYDSPSLAVLTKGMLRKSKGAGGEGGGVGSVMLYWAECTLCYTIQPGKLKYKDYSVEFASCQRIVRRQK